MKFTRSMVVIGATGCLVAGANSAALAATAPATSAKSAALSHFSTALRAGTSGDKAIVVPAPTSGRLHNLARQVNAADDTAVLVVHARPGTTVEALTGLARDAGGSIRDRLNSLGSVSFAVPADRAASVAEELRQQPGVSSVTTAVRRKAFGTPNDTYFASKQAGYLGAVTAPSAWTVQPGSAAVKIAIVDTGVDTGHPDLAGKVVGQYNAVTGGTDVTDVTGHGTFVAGVAAAVTNNGLGVAGAGNASSLLAVKVEDANGDIWTDRVAAGITWAVDHGANVINLSLGSPYSDPTESNAIAYAQSHGVVVVAAAGNDGQGANAVNYPAGYPSVISVGATDAAGGRAYFSEYGNWVSVAAPGVNIYSTAPRAGSEFFPQSYAEGDGTSFSSPIVAGEVALLAAAAPNASTADLRDAVVRTAHEYSGLGLGTGQVDFQAAVALFGPDTAPTMTAPAASAHIGGTVAVSATSTAAAVRFRIDGKWLGALVPTVNGAASTNWSTWGMANGSHTVDAVDCTAQGSCGTASASVTIDVANSSPTLTSPTSAAQVSGSFTMTATSPSGGVAFLIDGVRRGFDASAPYSYVNSSTLADGNHTANAVECDASGTNCAGPASATIGFTSRSLHPAFTSVAPTTFSPNGDGRSDTVKATFRLSDGEAVVASVRNAAGATVRAVNLSSLAAGSHSWTWDGRGANGVRLPDGAYTIALSTTRMVGATLLHGAATAAVRVDTMAPTMASITGNGMAVFPVVDGYLDTVAPAVTLTEPVTLTLTVRSTAGAVMRVLTASKPAGRTSISWNGRNGSNANLWPGSYRWTYTTADAAGNQRVTPLYTVNVSGQQLVNRTFTSTANGNAAYAGGASPSYCGEASLGYSDFANGLWLMNVCNPGVDGASITAGFYQFRVPGAVRYLNVRLDAYGNTISPPTAVRAAFLNAASGNYGNLTAGAGISSSANYWYNLGSQSATSLVDGNHIVDAAVVVTNELGSPNDFDIGQVRLTITYQALQ